MGDLSRAIQLRNDGEFDEAIELMQAAIADRPTASEPYRRLAECYTQLDREEELRQLLRLWSKSARGSDRLEPLLRLFDRLDMIASPADAAERELVRARVESIKAKLLDRAGPDRVSRLKVLVAARDPHAILEVLGESTAHENASLKPNLLLSIIRVLDGVPNLPPISRVLDVETVCQSCGPHLMAHLARIAEQTGDFEIAMQIDGRLAEQDVQFENSFVRMAQQLTSRRRYDDLGALLHKWSERFPDSARRYRFVIDYELSRDGLDDALAAARRLVAQPGANAADYLRLSDLYLKNGDDRDALAVVTEGIARFPGSPKLLARAGQISNRLGDEAAASEARRKAQLYEDLDRSFVESIGEEPLLRFGGRSAVHTVFDDFAGANGPTDGILDLADLALASLRNLVAIRPGRRREAAELRAYGAAQWEAVEPRASRLGRFILSLCHQAALQDRTETRALCTALEAVLLLEWNGKLAASLCRALIARYGTLSGLQRDWLWRIALGLECPEESRQLMSEITAVDPSRGQHVHHLRLNRAEDPGSIAPELTLFAQEAKPVQKPIRVVAELGDQTADLTIRVSQTLGFGPISAGIWAGCFVEYQRGEAFCPDNGAGIIRRDAVIAASGARGVLVRAPDEIKVIDEPLLFVPGTHAHYAAYFHFIGQILPIILKMRRTIDVPGLRIGIPDYAPRFVHDLLELANVDPAEIMLIPRTQTVQARNLFTHSPCPLDFQAEPDDIMALQDQLRKPGRRTRKRRKLFLARPLSAVSMAGRSLVNEVELEELARSRGYESVNPLAFSLADQRDFFAEAAVLCGPTGAALANCVFMPPGGELICMSPRQTCRTYYPGMALGSAQGFTWVLGSFLPDTEGARSFPHLPYIVPPAVLERAL